MTDQHQQMVYEGALASRDRRIAELEGMLQECHGYFESKVRQGLNNDGFAPEGEKVLYQRIAAVLR